MVTTHVRYKANARIPMTDDSPDSPLIVYVTAPDINIARELAERAVAAGDAACVNIVPGVESTYRWRGRIETDREVLLLIKTRRARLPALDSLLAAVHPDEVPERIAVAISDGLPAYMAWLDEQTR